MHAQVLQVACFCCSITNSSFNLGNASPTATHLPKLPPPQMR